MELKGIISRVPNLLCKYKYAVLVLVIGIVLMLLPSFDVESKANVDKNVTVKEQDSSMEQRLADLVSVIHGAGKSHVMLTTETGEEIVYQTDQEISTNNNSKNTHIDTVLITDAQRNQSGLVHHVNSPIYMGAVVVCEGAENPNVKLAVVDAVSKLTGLGADKISVLKMK